MEKANGLSRRPDWQEGVKKDNEDQTLIKLEQIRRVETLVEEGDPRKRIQKAQKGDEKIVKVVEELKGVGIKLLKNKKQEIEDEVIMKEGQIYVLEGELRGEIIQLHHDTPVGGHGGRQKIMELVTRNYQWPEVTKKVGKYVDGCDACQRYKNRAKPQQGNLYPMQFWKSHEAISQPTLSPNYHLPKNMIIKDRIPEEGDIK